MSRHSSDLPERLGRRAGEVRHAQVLQSPASGHAARRSAEFIGATQRVCLAGPS
jgi:hypothetical protein